MWQRAKTTPQKTALLDGFLPITADDFVKAVIHFSGDDDEYVWKKAVEKLAGFSQDEIKKHIDSDIPQKSALAIAKYAADKKDPSLIIILISLNKLDPGQLITYIQIEDEDFWRTLVTHKDFVTFSIPLKGGIIVKSRFAVLLILSIFNDFRTVFCFTEDKKFSASIKSRFSTANVSSPSESPYKPSCVRSGITKASTLFDSIFIFSKHNFVH